MTYFGSSLTAPTSGLTAANINQLIQETLNAQRGPIRTLTNRKDELNVRKAIYSDLKSMLTTFKTIVEHLTSTDEDTVLDDMSVTSSDTSVATATVTSSAGTGTYAVEVTTLAKAHRVRSDQVTSSSQALNLSGTFTLNGASITVESDDSLGDIMDAVNAAEDEYGQLLFSVGLDYESDLDDGLISTALQDEFDAEGISLSDDATVTVEEEGNRWLITDHQTKYSIRKDGAELDVHEGGKEVMATIVDNHLVLEAASTGASNTITYTDTDGILFELGMLTGDGSFADITPFAFVAQNETISGGSGLDDGTIADELKTAFANDGITLSAGATVTVVEANERWQITDNGRTYYVENYDAGNDDNRLEIYATAPFAFVAQNATISDLDDSTIATELGTAFANNGITLSTSAAVTVVEANERWQITDSGKTYYVENYDAGKNDNRLKIYTKSEPLEAAADASFDVNGITVTRAWNTGLDDVISGVTLSLLSETEDEDTATSDLVVSPDYTAIRAKVSAFVSNLNSTLSYLKAKTGTTVDQDNEVYTRGGLAGETIFSMLRADLIATVSEEITGGSLRYLEDIGITVGSGLTISLDTDTLNSKMESNFDDVVTLFDGVMAEYVSILEPFTATTSSSNTIDMYSDSVETQIENIENRIERMEELLEAREGTLIKQYSGLYLQSMQIQNQQHDLLSIYSAFSIWA